MAQKRKDVIQRKSLMPEKLRQAERYFSNEKVCVEFISKLKWGAEGKPFCPKCGSDNVIGLSTRPIFKCREKGCKKQFSIKVGTVFQDSALPLSKLLPALWIVCNDGNLISSYGAARFLGIHQSSAWYLLQRIYVGELLGDVKRG